MAKKVEAEAAKLVDFMVDDPKPVNAALAGETRLALLTRPLDPWQVYEKDVEDPKRGPFHMHYTSSHDVRNRLDEVLGPQNWRAHYQSDPQGVRCVLEIRASLLVDYTTPEPWLEKTGHAAYHNPGLYSTESTDAEAFKRAALEWGIGRELYRKGTVHYATTAPEDVLKRVAMLLPDYQHDWEKKAEKFQRSLDTPEKLNPFSVTDAIAFIQLAANGENADYLACFRRPGWVEWVVAQYAKDRSIQVWKTLKKAEDEPAIEPSNPDPSVSV